MKTGQSSGPQLFEENWWALKDLNLRPTDYESAALTKHELEGQMRLAILAIYVLQMQK